MTEWTYVGVGVIDKGIEKFYRLPDTHASASGFLEVLASLEVECDGLLLYLGISNSFRIIVHRHDLPCCSL